MIYDIYKIEPLRVQTDWNEQDGFQVKLLPSESVDFDQGGEQLFASNVNRVVLPNGERVSLDRFLSNEQVRLHVLGLNSHVPNVGYFNTGDCCMTIRRIGKHLSRLMSNYSWDDEFTEHAPEVNLRAAFRSKNYHMIAQAALSARDGLDRLIDANSSSGKHPTAELQMDRDYLEQEISSMMSAVPPLRVYQPQNEGDNGERLVFVEDVLGEGSVVYLGLKAKLLDRIEQGILRGSVALHDFMNAIRVQKNDVLREPGFLLGMSGGMKVWNAGSNLSNPLVIGDFVRPPRGDVWERAGKILSNGIVCPSEKKRFKRESDQDMSGSLDDRHVHLMESAGVCMCDVSFKQKAFPATFMSYEAGRENESQARAAVVVMRRGTMTLTPTNTELDIELHAGNTYLFPPSVARGFSLMPMGTPASCMVSSNKLVAVSSMVGW